MAIQSIGFRFEKFVADVFRAEGFVVETGSSSRLTSGSKPGFFGQVDLFVRSKKGAAAVVEVKAYRSQSMPLSVLANAATVLESLRDRAGVAHGIVVVSNRVSSVAKDFLRPEFPRILIYDFDTLASLVSKHASLVSQFEAITRELASFSDIVPPQPVVVDVEADISQSQSAELVSVATRNADVDSEGHRRGFALCQLIKATPTGRVHAKRFEKHVEDALRYIFETDLTAWSPQKSTDTKMSINDLVVRVASDHDFWRAIVSQFRSRYVVFEFKNYSSKIKQGQIYTTEKYLFGPALRSTAIVISRSGADKNALVAARGALREHGKLIINLDVDDLCEMLHRKDSGDDHNAVLVEHVDEMLMKLER